MPDWDVSQVTDMSSAFLGRTTFNADISQWSTSSATTTYIMFKNAAAFNQDISGWDVSSVVTMQGMFNMQSVEYFGIQPRHWRLGHVPSYEYEVDVLF